MIALVGEAYGADEERERRPFVGAAGKELNRLLAEAGIHRADCLVTNVFNLRPKGNKIENFCGDKKGSLVGYPALAKSKYVRKEFEPELKRLADELCEANPNIVVALGNTPMWALTGQTTISRFRGTTVLSSKCVAGFKVLPTYHPASLFKGPEQWANRPIIVADLTKAKRESTFPEIRRVRREIWIEPEEEDIYEFFRSHVNLADLLSVDIETSGREITCIGFAPSRSLALVVPFYDAKRKDRNYWPTADHERRVWSFLRSILESPRPRKLFQNGLYDIAFLYKGYGIRVAGAAEDTMLLHYSLQPESLKSLGFMGSVYCDEGAWKEMRKGTTNKRDE